MNASVNTLPIGMRNNVYRHIRFAVCELCVICFNYFISFVIKPCNSLDLYIDILIRIRTI